MTDFIPPSRKALAEALELSAEILRNLELNELPLKNVTLKISRLARLINDFDVQKIMQYEVGGYSTTPTGVPPEIWRLLVAAKRTFEKNDDKTNTIQTYAYLTSITELEEQLRIAEVSLNAARDPDISISSANPSQIVWNPTGNYFERNTIRQSLSDASSRIASRQTFLYEYTLRKHYELKFSGIAEDLFTRVRERVDSTIGQIIPEAAKKMTSVYNNLQSDNPEDWSNAVHSCRRVLQELADSLFPPTNSIREREINGKIVSIKLGRDQYINRLLAYVEDTSESTRFQELVGSHMKFLADRLDSIFKAAQKGSHSTIMKREEADRHVIYTYLIVGDILSLKKSTTI